MLHVLIADDDASIRGLLATILGNSECSVDLVSNGQEAIRAFEDFEYDLVITDLEMPRCDGKVLTRSIRQHNTSIPVVMITGCANPEAMSMELKEAGVSKIISKPFQVGEILALRSLLAEKSAAHEVPAS